MTTVISFILVFGLLVSIHELGHFLLAKRAGMLVREFAIGFGPKILSFKKGETLYNLRLLPLGGYVRVAGEDPEMVEIKTGHDVALLFDDQGKVTHIITNNKKEYPNATIINVQRIDLVHKLVIEGYDEQEELLRFEVDPKAKVVFDHQEVQIAPHDRQYASKTIGQRAAYIFAGPLANLLLAFVILVGSALYIGVPINEPVLGEITEEGAAQSVGLQKGDRVVRVDQQPVQSWIDLVEIISTNPNQELLLTIERNGQQLQVPITPMARESRIEESRTEGYIGVWQPSERSVTGSLQYGFVRSVDFAQLIFTYLGKILTGGFNIDDLAGPVGIFQITGQAAQEGLPMLMFFTAFLSVNLAIFNLLPIPALDVGRLLFIAIEALRGRPIDPQKEGMVHFIGFALLMLLILVVTWNDIQRVFFN